MGSETGVFSTGGVQERLLGRRGSRTGLEGSRDFRKIGGGSG